MNRIILAFSGLGKTWLSLNRLRCVDLDVYYFNYNPYTTFCALTTYKDLDYTLLTIPDCVVIYLLSKYNHDFEVVLPDDEMKEEIIKRIKERKDVDLGFTSWIDTYYDSWIEDVKRMCEFCNKKITYLKKGQYLSDLIEGELK